MAMHARVADSEDMYKHSLTAGPITMQRCKPNSPNSPAR
jgi:hypothetical protein